MQGDLEKVSDEKNQLEQDYENQLNRRNQEDKEMGMVIRSINNIFSRTLLEQQKKGKCKKVVAEDCKETDPDLVESLVQKLKDAGEVI